MSLRRFVAAAAVAVIMAAVPVTTDADAPVGLRLSAASCAEEGCGGLSKMDCICPDMQMNNRKPRCVEP